MHTRVAYTNHTAARRIAEHISERLRAAGLEVGGQPAKGIAKLAGYDAVVPGSALHYGAWMKEAVNFASA